MNATACYFVTGMEHENAEIARGLRRRDADLLDRLIEQYQHRLLRYLVYLAGNRELAEDLFQETWMMDGLMEDERHAPLEPADPRPMAWEVVQQHEQSERVSAALVSIPAEYREAVVLRFQEGLALDEIATVTGSPLGTVKSRLYRGLNMLMSRLKGAQA